MFSEEKADVSEGAKRLELIGLKQLPTRLNHQLINDL